KVVGLHMGKLNRYEAEWLYASQKGKPHFEPLVEFMTSGPVVMMVIEGEGAVARWRELMGATDSRTAAEGTIRWRWGGYAGVRPSGVHGSDGREAGERELDFFFAGFEEI